MSVVTILDERVKIVLMMPSLIADLKFQLQHGARLVMDADDLYIVGLLRGNIPSACWAEVIEAIEPFCDYKERDATAEWTWKK